MDSFGKRFKAQREKMELTQEELRELFNKRFHYNFTGPAISQYENDKRIPEIDALKSFADFFDVSVDYLLCRTDDPETKIVPKESLPPVLSQYVDYIEILKDANIEDITPEELKHAIDFAKKIKGIR